MPKLLIGLGNPGADYAPTRHNAGFWLLDAAAKRLKIAFTRQPTLNADIATRGGLRLLKPQTWMNNSGAAAAAAAKLYGAAAQDILVAHDEVDLPPGIIRLKFGGGTAGHNGLADICRRLGDNNYWRVRMGVGKTADGAEGADSTGDYVLRAPAAAEAALICAAIERFVAVWHDIAADDYQRAMRVLHTDG